MKVSELITLLQKYNNDDEIVVIAKDVDGLEYSPIFVIDKGYYVSTDNKLGFFLKEDTTKDDLGFGLGEWDSVLKNREKCVVLFPKK